MNRTHLRLVTICKHKARCHTRNDTDLYGVAAIFLRRTTIQTGRFAEDSAILNEKTGNVSLPVLFSLLYTTTQRDLELEKQDRTTDPRQQILPP